MRKLRPWIGAAIGIAIIAFVLTREPKRPAFPRWEKIPANSVVEAHPDIAEVRSLLGENLPDRRFSFAVVAEACSGKKVLPLDESEAHRRMVSAIQSAVAETIAELNQADSPSRELSGINEVSKFFGNVLMERINRTQSLRCDIPPARNGKTQRAGYPDLRVVDESSGTVFCIGAELADQDSARTFQFEPNDETLRINEDAVHLLFGIEHYGNGRERSFRGWRMVDLSTVQISLKTEFMASDSDLYSESMLSLPAANP